MSVQVPVRIQTGAPVRIDGKKYSAGPVISGGRVFYDKEAGTQIVVSEVQQLRMALHLRLLDDKPFEKLKPSRRQSLRIDFGTFSPEERWIALGRARFVLALDKVQPPLQRSKKKNIERIIEEVWETGKIRLKKKPNARQVRTWYRYFVVGGRDVRALAPCNWAKGRRGERYAQWHLDTINRLISDKLVSPTPASFRQVRMRADRELRNEAARRGEKLQRRDGTAIDGIGGKLVARLFRERDKFGVMVDTTNWREAERRSRAIQLGPQGECVNNEWEVDHTLLDILVIDEETMQIVGRPWLTAIIDRYSRCIVGFSLSFAHPSWASVMDALRVAVMPKDWVYEGFKVLGNGQSGIQNRWECYGKPDRLIMDHGRDFKSLSMDATLTALVIEPDYTKPKKPWLKGKIERWFGTLERQIVHTLPGTVMSKWEDRKFYNSEKLAVLTIDEVNWIVAKWVIDIYHQDQHSKIGRSPAQAWKEGLKEITPHREIPKDLLVPLTGLIVPRTLRDGGIRYKGLRWDSPDLSRTRGLLPDSADVQVRIDPLDITLCHVYDTEREIWVEGELEEPVAARGKTLGQWLTISRLRRRLQQEKKLDHEEALARAFEQIDIYVRQRIAERKRGLAPKRFAAFVSSQSAWSSVRPVRFDLDHDAPRGHSLDLDQNDSPQTPNHGPFKEPKRRWMHQDEGEERGPEDGAREQEFERRADEQAAEDVVVSPEVPYSQDAPDPPADGAGSTAEDDAADAVDTPPESTPTDDDDDDDHDDVTPIGFGRD
jgi:transposase InsO family protein